jgi:Tol biopolymer transport system component
MTLTAGTKLGPYEIQSALGAGGMGEVYRARDTRLDRIVAVKVLAPQLAADPQFRERFDREGRAISALDHPNICALYDVGEQAPSTGSGQAVAYLVMQYLEGETLAERLQRGPLPLNDALMVATQVADALDKAHRAGFTHRDLKPGNIMLTKSGAARQGAPQAKLLDFGLAKSGAGGTGGPGRSEVGQGFSAAHLSMAPTMSSPLTAQGSIVGTWQYMAPEQLEGKEADARTDIFALGVVLYETLTGRKAFEGKTQASLIAAIMHVDPPTISTFQPLTPAWLDRIVKKCLEKDPQERWQSAKDLLDVLRWSAAGELAAGTSSSGRARRRGALVAWTTAGVALAAAAALALLRAFEPAPAASLVRFSVSAPPDTAFLSPATITPVNQSVQVISPDGKHLAFLARHGGEPISIWVRSLESLAARRLAGTEGAGQPFWSADSGSIGFFAGGKLKRIDLAGGSAQLLCDAPAGAGGAWNREGTILLAPTANSPLYRVAAAGGEPAPVTSLDLPSGKLTFERWPAFLPDGRHFLFFGPPGTVFVGSLDSKDVKPLVKADSQALYASGYLLFQRQATLFAQPFDIKRLEVTGDAVPAAQELGLPVGGAGKFTASNTGVLAYRGDDVGGTELRWFDRHGKLMGTVGDSALYINPSLSADGARVMTGRRQRNQPTFDLWLFDLSRNIPSRFTFDAGTEFLPVWSPDGKYVAYTMDHGTSKHDIYRRLANGAGEDEVVFASEANKRLTDWTSEGKFLVFDEATETGLDLSYVPVSGDRKSVSYLKTKFNEGNGHVSSDGRWIAYQSDESGRSEIYVRPFPDAQGGKWQISGDGGSDPRWRRDGTELFYFAGDDKLMAVTVRPDASGFATVKTEPLFQVAKTTNLTNYAVTADGQRFLVNAILDTGNAAGLTVVLNWTATLKK